jgi:hypothetical protein
MAYPAMPQQVGFATAYDHLRPGKDLFESVLSNIQRTYR